MVNHMNMLQYGGRGKEEACYIISISRTSGKLLLEHCSTHVGAVVQSVEVDICALSDPFF